MDVKDPESGEVTFKRVLTGEVTKDAYPAVFTEHEWLAANHCLDSRRRGTQVGRNVVSYANLFGDLAVCGVCGGRMKIRGKGRLGPFKYFGCSNAALHKKRKSGEPVSKIIPVCDNTQYYRLDKIEADILPRVADEVVDDSPQDDDPAETLTKRIAKMKAEAAQIERDYMASMRRTGHLAEMTQAKLERDHAGKLTAIGKVERELAAHHAAKPMGELQETVRTVLARALVGDVAARAKIAESLPGLLGTVTCRSDGKWDWISKSGVIQCGGEPVMWASRSFKMKA
jgi:hypothetical protein